MKITRAIVLVLSILLLGCQKSGTEEEKHAERDLALAGYNPTAYIEKVSLIKDNWVRLEGKTIAQGRARFTIRGQSTGFTADSKGQFNADLPIDEVGSLYEFSFEDSDRLLITDGLLFIPGAPLDYIYNLRPGAKTKIIGNPDRLMVIIDMTKSQGKYISGYSNENAKHTVYCGDNLLSELMIKDNRSFEIDTSYLNKCKERLSIKTPTQEVSFSVDILLYSSTADEFSSEVNKQDGGWTFSWPLPGGGEQKTIILMKM